MKLSLEWLNDFIDIKDLDVNELREIYTMQAFEVEDLESTVKLLDSKIVLGKILEIAKHPDADKLQVTKTQVNDKDILQIVCGAKNIAVGQQVPVALIGAQVLSRSDASSFEIKKSKIRGVESNGMLCSAGEMGLEGEDGILIMDNYNFPLGTSMNEVLGLKADYVFDIGARSNRGDALSVYGQARELAAITNKSLKYNIYKNEFDTNKNITKDDNYSPIKPEIEDLEDCELFYTCSIKNLSLKASPEWLQKRLKASGMKAINNLVDVSNYLLMELGQPMHCYDTDKLSGKSLKVRRAKAGEQLLTLEDRVHELNESNLVIADDKEAVSLAGVMGGKNNSISDTSKNITIEVAVFNPAVIRKSSRTAGVESESKRRFERGVDKSLAKTALIRAVEILSEIACDNPNEKIVVGQIMMAGNDELKTTNIELNPANIKRYLGKDIDSAQIDKILESLSIKKISNNNYSIPSYRAKDLTREIDLVEEIARLIGYDSIAKQAPRLISNDIDNQVIKECASTKAKINKSKNIFLANGYSQVILSSLIGESLENLNKELNEISTNINGENIEMDNPLSQEHRSLRQSLLPGLIQAASRNYAYDKSEEIKLFEIGKIYGYSHNKTNENLMIAAIYSNPNKRWNQNKIDEAIFYEFKNIIENLLDDCELKKIESQQNSRHPSISALILDQRKKPLGQISKIHPSLSKEWDLDHQTYLLELKIPTNKNLSMQELSFNPIIERDITADCKCDYQDIHNMISKNSSSSLQSIKLISTYKISDELTSLSMRLKWQSKELTLSGEEIDTEVNKLKSLLEKELSVTFRSVAV
ncbi:MAG: phenylalanine--tRNA ligase subunit beta [Candidatus Caenarcaniphilales bacterium]|jgi:phenylalanyl-tRNA synthetase beta chain|nr:phenylalanine--tRNA ligase subunit beta [Candidatus Caenarcaniphilales bacterium]